jgi:hypothetical protein
MTAFLDLVIMALLIAQICTHLSSRRTQRKIYECQHLINELTNERLRRLEALNFGVEIEESSHE